LIFVSVGTLEKPFNRLLEGMDNVADKVNEVILVQTGHSTYVPKKCNFFKFCSYEEMLTHIDAASIVISHSGFGIIGNSIRLKKPMILVPREIKYGEAIDKQYELAQYMASQNKSILCVRDVNQLAEAIEEIRKFRVAYHYHTTIPELIEQYISRTFFC
jgi:UDP-N-acetylglucosamine transferase subunit ALG13